MQRYVANVYKSKGKRIYFLQEAELLLLVSFNHLFNGDLA